MSTNPIDPEVYPKQVEDAFRKAGQGREAVYIVADDLFMLKRIGDGFVKEEEYENATNVYQAIVWGILDRYETYPNVEVLDDVLYACGEAVDEYALEVEENEKLYERCIIILLGIYRWKPEHHREDQDT